MVYICSVKVYTTVSSLDYEISIRLFFRVIFFFSNKISTAWYDLLFKKEGCLGIILSEIVLRRVFCEWNNCRKEFNSSEWFVCSLAEFTHSNNLITHLRIHAFIVKLMSLFTHIFASMLHNSRDSLTLWFVRTTT